jgi:predicted O-linked N-acetylglucosamine transferase (SPINDLY family)
MFKEGNPNQVPSQETQSIVEAPKPQLTEQELRDKYEINNRKRLARGFLAERQNIRKAEEVKKLQLLSQLESKKTQNSNDLKNLQSDPNKTVSEIEGRLLDIDSRVTRYTENISKRNFFDKLKFKVIKDEIAASENIRITMGRSTKEGDVIRLVSEMREIAERYAKQ